MNKICVIHLIRDTGGVARVVLELANAQIEAGLHVVVVYTSLTEDFIRMFDNRIVLEKISISKWLPPMVFGLGMHKIFNKYKQLYTRCVIHAHNIATVGLFSSSKNIPMVCSLHGISWFGEMNIRKKLSRFLVTKKLLRIQKNKGEIVSVSYATADYYNKLCKSNVSSCVHNGIKSDAIPIKHSAFTIGFIGDISEAKGWNVLVDAISMIPQEDRDNIQLLVAGTAKNKSKSEIEREMMGIGLDNKAKYLGFIYDAYHIVMPQIDVLVLPSLSEGLPMSIIEAQSLGIPVIATGVGGIPEIIHDGENGLLIERNTNRLCESILKLKNDISLYSSMSNNSKDIFSKSYSSEIMCAKYLNIYEALKEMPC